MERIVLQNSIRSQARYLTRAKVPYTLRTRCLGTTAQPLKSIETPSISPNPQHSHLRHSPSASSTHPSGSSTKTVQSQTSTASPSSPTSESSTSPAGPLTASLRERLPLLKAQPSHYITIHIHGRPYLVTVGDTLRLPFRMPEVEPGDILRLDRAAAIGSRDYTLHGSPYVDPRVFVCRATVMGTESEPMRVIEKKKQRERRITHVRSKHRYTILRIAELKIRSVEDVERGMVN